MSLIKMEQIGKTFGAVKALENVDFELKKGEIHALLGENGAGKTTLMKVLYGMYRADKGSLYYEDKKVEINNSREAIELGIGMVHQHFMLIPVLTVAENIVVGMEPKKGLRFDFEQAVKEVEALSETYGFHVESKGFRFICRRAAAGGDFKGAVSWCRYPDSGRTDRSAHSHRSEGTFYSVKTDEGSGKEYYHYYP